MRRLSIQFTCLLALVPALGLGCASSHEDAPDAAFAGDFTSAEARVEGKSYGGSAATPSMDYDYGDDMVASEEAPPSAPSGAAPTPSAAPAPMAEAADAGVGAGAGVMGGGDGEGRATGASSRRTSSAKSKDSTASIATASDKPSSKGGKIARDEREEAKPAKIAADNRQIQSGTLTAGSFDDNLNPWVWDKFVDQARAQPDLAQLASAFAGRRTVLKVQDAHGRPVGNATVEIDGKRVKTRTDGRAVWVQGWDSGAQGRGKAKISHGNASKTISINDQVEQLVTLADTTGSLPTRLDIALVIDATGSMGDELEFLKVEIRDIADAINRHFPNVDQRFALVVYRDVGDQYETRVFDFTGDIDAFQRDLSAQSASGGGDYPEAMDAALAAATKLSWRADNAAKVTFLVADAPPHNNDIDDTLAAVDGLRSQGVAIYPVASSGVAGEAEFVMRASALLTGAQYLFLTDDSGVGNPHAEPHIPCYTVEQLAPLMVRAVRSELSGRRVEAEEQFTIRTVGKGQSGMCEKPRATKKIAR